MKNRLDNSFGYQRVTPRERQARIQAVFDAVAPRYDVMNDAMSFGVHRLWKQALVRCANPRPHQLVVDLAGGTGDVALRLAGTGCRVIIADPSLKMMATGRRRSANSIAHLACRGEFLALADRSVDIVTVAFGIRNMTRMETALAEIFRILKPGGRCLCLEFSRPHALLRPLYDFYSFHVIPRLGAWIARQPNAYSYLVESIREFPDQEGVKSIMERVGFGDVCYKNLTLGITCIHQGRKV